MYCTNCGKKIDSNNRYCTNCGKRVERDTKKNEPNRDNTSPNLPLILGVFSLICIPIPEISIPLAITSIFLAIKSKTHNKLETLGVILGIFSIIITIFLFISTLFVVPLAKELIDSIDSNNYDNDTQQIIEPELSGYKWVGSDNSTLFLKKDGTFEWNKKTNNTDQSLYGKYETYNGEEAIQYIEQNLPQYKFFNEENNQSSSEQLQYTYLLILNSNTTTSTIYFYGQISTDGKELQLTNLQDNNLVKFKKQDTLSGIDI